jgi:hypothetical protein
MQISRKALNTRWAWSGVAAILLLAGITQLDSILRAKTGFGTADLQGVSSGYGIRSIADHWTSPPDAVLAGFCLGLDYLAIPLYGAALFFGSAAAIVRFAPSRGGLNRILSLLSLAPVGAAISDGLENALQLYMLTHASTNTMASLALEATAAKWLGIAIGLALTLAALVGMIVKKRV